MKKYLAMILSIILLTSMLPMSAFALSSAGSTSMSRTQINAESYTFKFGLEHQLYPNDMVPAYTAPSTSSVRATNGKAVLSTNGEVYSAGWYGSWLLVRYEKNNGGYRVGWAQKSSFTQSKNGPRVEATRSVSLTSIPVTLAYSCAMTDDPLYESDVLAYADKGEKLTYLAYYQYRNGTKYAYVQGYLNGQELWGFIPYDAINWQ